MTQRIATAAHTKARVGTSSNAGTKSSPSNPQASRRKSGAATVTTKLGPKPLAPRKQHVQPCKECPFRRVAPRGWLGDFTPENFMDHAHSESVMDCHLGTGTLQCAGAAIYRANVGKRTRYPALIISLPKDKEAVFANQQEFIEHHTRNNKGVAK